MPQKLFVTDLLAALEENPDGTYRERQPPHRPPSRLPPNTALLQQAFVVMERDGKPVAYVCWSREQLQETVGGAEPRVLLGGSLPATHVNPRLELGGDYPQLFEHLRDCERNLLSPLYYWDEGGGGIWPTSADEPCGMLYGAMRYEWHRVWFCFDKESARSLFTQLTNEHSSWGPITDMTRPYLERSTLPETGGGPVLKLDLQAARWLCCWYCQYQRSTGQIR